LNRIRPTTIRRTCYPIDLDKAELVATLGQAFQPAKVRTLFELQKLQSAATIISLTLFWSTGANAATKSSFETAGTAVAISLPIVATGVSLLHDDDWDGIAELSVSTVATVGIAYGLSHIVREQRPDHSDFHSFPSDTAALAYAPADYLWARYGWQYGIPAYAAAMFVGYSRVDAKKHHWYDVMASSAIAFGVNYAIVTRYHASTRYSVSASADPEFTGIHFAMNW
jgi:membrane-associated phospholipid phosphatase